MIDHPFRPLFVEVPREKSQGGAADLSSLAHMFKTLYARDTVVVTEGGEVTRATLYVTAPFVSGTANIDADAEEDANGH